jgi:alanine dehydrogenase
MRIGVPKEIKNHEYRVGLTPESVAEVIAHGHQVLVESGAGIGIGCTDDSYRSAGAEIAESPEAVFSTAELIVKVKEPLAPERRLLRPGQVLFTYLHLAPDPSQTKDLLASGAICIAYETITGEHGRLPLLAPMSHVAGRMAIQAGATALEKAHGGRGILLGGVPGVRPAKVTVIGGGVVGENAVEMALGVGAEVTVVDANIEVLERLAKRFGTPLRTAKSSLMTLTTLVTDSDLVVGSVLIKGAAAPKLVTRKMVAAMRPGSVVVDVAIDQGGCFETSHATTHTDPTYVEEGVVHYCVANMPGAVPWTSTYALNNATLPYVLLLADRGYRDALLASSDFLSGLNIYRGKLTEPSVATEQGLAFTAPQTALAN